MGNKNQVIDETAKSYGRLEVKKRGPDQLQADGKKYRAQWWCECSCGFLCVLVLGKTLRNKRTRSCGCIRKETAREAQITKNRAGTTRGRVINEIGNRYDMLTVVAKAPQKAYPSGTTFAAWYCECSCGNPEQVIKTGNYLRKARVYHSCGCETSKTRSAGYEKLNPHQERVRKHIQALAFYGKVELEGEYIDEGTRTEYTCLLHGKTYPALPMNTQRGRGLRCCRLSQGARDSVSAIINNTVRRTDLPAFLYAFHMANYDGLIKIGIATDLSVRPDEEYGALIKSWSVDKRIIAVAIEAALKENTFGYCEMPEKLSDWAGRTEIRRMSAGQVVEEMEYLISSYNKLGLWDFLLQTVPLTQSQRQQINAKLGLKAP